MATLVNSIHYPLTRACYKPHPDLPSKFHWYPKQGALSLPLARLADPHTEVHDFPSVVRSQRLCHKQQHRAGTHLLPRY